MRKTSFIFAALLSFSGILVHAQASAGPRIPFIDRGACPFECCTYRRWDVERPTIVRSAMSDKAVVKFRLKRGEKVQGLTGVVITTRPGILRVKQDTELAGQRLNKGDKIYLLTYLGEGYSKIWFAGTIFSGDPYEADTYETIQEARAVWWVKIKNRAGKIGWSRQPEHFGNMDQCG